MIILIQGPPASGKTTVAKALSQRFSLPHISRDIIQEWLFEVDDKMDDKTSSFCAHAGYDLMFRMTGEMAKGPGSFIVEGCINPETGPVRMKEALGNHQHKIIEIFLTAEDSVLVERYLARADSTQRHKAHSGEASRGEQLAEHLKKCKYKPMNIGEEVFVFDNSEDPEMIQEEVLLQIESVLIA